MTWYAIYRTSDGRLRAEGSTPSGFSAAQLATRGLAEKSFAGDRPANQWNPATLEYDIAPPDVFELTSPVAFFNRFTNAERNALRDTNNFLIQTAVIQLQTLQEIDAGSDVVREAMEAFVLANILTDARRDAILNASVATQSAAMARLTRRLGGG